MKSTYSIHAYPHTVEVVQHIAGAVLPVVRLTGDSDCLEFAAAAIATGIRSRDRGARVTLNRYDARGAKIIKS